MSNNSSHYRELAIIKETKNSFLKEMLLEITKGIPLALKKEMKFKYFTQEQIVYMEESLKKIWWLFGKNLLLKTMESMSFV